MWSRRCHLPRVSHPSMDLYVRIGYRVFECSHFVGVVCYSCEKSYSSLMINWYRSIKHYSSKGHTRKKVWRNATGGKFTKILQWPEEVRAKCGVSFRSIRLLGFRLLIHGASEPSTKILKQYFTRNRFSVLKWVRKELNSTRSLYHKILKKFSAFFVSQADERFFFISG